jgi:hypothetical protein
MVYFAQTPTSSIKIGYADCVSWRITSLRKYYGGEVALLTTRPGYRERERVIHARFKHLRFSGTEQFRPALELYRFVRVRFPEVLDPDKVEVARPVVDEERLRAALERSCPTSLMAGPEMLQTRDVLRSTGLSSSHFGDLRKAGRFPGPDEQHGFPKWRRETVLRWLGAERHGMPEIPHDLAVVIVTWPGLPDAVKDAVMHLDGRFEGPRGEVAIGGTAMARDLAVVVREWPSLYGGTREAVLAIVRLVGVMPGLRGPSRKAVATAIGAMG